MPGRWQVRRGTAGSAPSEVLVMALVVLIVFVAASPFHRAARREAARLRCLAGRRLIADAQERYRADSAEHRYASGPAQLRDLLPAMPRCPEGGRYRFLLTPRGRIAIVCSVAGHRAYISHVEGPPGTL